MGLAGLIVSALAAAPFVAVEQAEALVRDGAAVLDARGGAAFEVGHLPGAQPIDWRALSRPRSGRLSDDTAGQARDLAALGVDAAKPVLVYGAAAAGHGEEGLVAWTIAWLGHSRVRILDGGFAAWAAAGRPIATGRARPPVPGRFPAQPAAALRAVLADARAPSAQLLDVRSAAEFAGPAGHIPGARNLDWSALLGEGGRVRSASEVRALVTRAGIDPSRPVITYCLSGVRAAEAWAALSSAGIPARSYEGSFREWVAHPELPVAGPAK